MNKLFIYLILSFFLLLQSALAYVVTVDLTWGFNASNPIQAGSIVQLIAWDTSNADKPPTTASGNFDQLGTYQDEPTYDYGSTPDNHEIIAEMTVQQNASGYFIFQQFVVADYNRIYLRYFSEPTLPDYEVQLSYWGLTVSRPMTGNTNKPVSLIYANLNPNNQNYFGNPEPYFEVIPEVSTLNLLFIGLACLLVKYAMKR